MKLINLGCGNVFHPDWINLDLAPSHAQIIACDIRQNLPYPDNFFDACYSSHVIEHLKPEICHQFLRECQRILKPNGIIRVVVPDLEAIAKTYLSILAKIEKGDTSAEANYDWILLELYDQTVRTFSGGAMKPFLINPNLQNKDFVLSRIGQEANFYFSSTKKAEIGWQKKRHKSLSWWLRKIQLMLAQWSVRMIAGKSAERGFKEGIFRDSGEIHHWMYDRFSLHRLLRQTGFINIEICNADESRIPHFKHYDLDTIQTMIRKPDSLFIEAQKPQLNFIL